MEETFANEIVKRLADSLKEWSSDADLAQRYKGPFNEQMEKLRDIVPQLRQIDSLKDIDEKADVGLEKTKTMKAIFDRAIFLRKIMPELMDEKEKELLISQWIVQVWGGIPVGKEEKFKKIIEDAENARKHEKDFNFYRIASWSKHLAFRYPNEYAIYDARVVYSLNWLLLCIYADMKLGRQQIKFFPFLPGQNSVMGMLSYEFLLLLKYSQQSPQKLKEEFKEDLGVRRSKPKGGDSYFAGNIKRNAGIYIEEKIAYKEYCQLLQRLAEELYRKEDQEEFRLTKTEMLLFAIADAEIAEDVLGYMIRANCMAHEHPHIRDRF